MPEVRPSRPLAADARDRPGHLGFVAHELRNPLSTALWSAELMTRLRPEERAGERGLKLATLGARALGRIQVLVEDHLLCERLDAGGYPLRLGRVEVATLVAAAVARLEPAKPPEVRLAPGLACHGDRALLERALEGVAAVAGRGGAAVSIDGERAGETIRLSVRGAPAEPVADPVKGALSDPGGRALSLPMARRVAEAHGGALTLDGAGYLLVFPAT
jgi:K+-sensing histidine kinase KdpD